MGSDYKNLHGTRVIAEYQGELRVKQLKYLNVFRALASQEDRDTIMNFFKGRVKHIFLIYL